MNEKLSESAGHDPVPVQPSKVPPVNDHENAAEMIVNVRHTPGNEAHWDVIDDDARDNDSPERGEHVYDEILGRPDLSQADLSLIGQRYVAFLEEWYGDPEKPIAVLRRVLQRDHQNRWALEKLSLLLTLAERWDELLATYDETLAHSSDKAQQIALLEEASRIAKDFAGQAQRASDYLKRLFLLKPTDTALATALERRLEQQDRHQDLVDIWESRLAVVDEATALELKIAIGKHYLAHLKNATKALGSARVLFQTRGGSAAACDLLEQLALAADAPLSTRREALSLLTDYYAAEERTDDVVRVLRQALQLVESDADRVQLNRDLVLWNVHAKDDLAAQYAAAEWFALAPSDKEALSQLQELAASTHDYEHLAEAIVRAAESTSDSRERAAHLLLAADSHTTQSRNLARAKVLFARVLDDATSDKSQKLIAAQQLTRLLLAREEYGQRLDVLEQLAQLDPDSPAKRAALGEAARLSEQTGDDARALRLWAECLKLDAADREAHDARISVLVRIADYPELLLALRARYHNNEDDAERRADLVTSARIYDVELQALPQATLLWQEIENVFGRNDETIDALVDVLQRAARWQELVELLASTHTSEVDLLRRTTQLTLLGEVYREHLGDARIAIAHYRRALQLQPAFEAARSGASALLEVDQVRAAAAETLAEAYRAAREWTLLLELVETRFGSSDTLAQRQQVLLEAAEVAEQQLGDPRLALDYVARAFALITDARVESTLHRLAGATGAWEVAVDGYQRALEYSSDAARNIELFLALGRVHEFQLNQWHDALASYRRVLSLDATSVDGACSVVRVAAETGEWDVACWALVTSAHSHAALLGEVTSSFEQAATQGDGLRWVSALDALGRAIRETRLAPRTSHDVKFQLAQWYRDRTGANASAIQVLSEAVDEHRQAASLEMLVALQQQQPSEKLVESLLKLADVVEEPLAQLYEASQVALSHIENPTLARPILERALTRAEHLLTLASDTETDAGVDAASVAAWSVAQLVNIATSGAEYRTAFDLLTRTAKLPLHAELVRSLQHDAALIAASHLGQPNRAIDLCKEVLRNAPDRSATITLLARLYEEEGHLEPLIALRTGELGLTRAATRRLELRLEISRVLGLLGGNDKLQLETLGENLSEAPGHGDTIDAIATLLLPESRFGELYEILVEQADAVNAMGESRRASQLFARAGELADVSLSDVEKALAAYRASVGLEPSTQVLDALGAIHSARNEHAEATAWLKQRYELTAPDDAAARQETLVRLGRSLRAGEKREEAITYLEAGLREDPAATQVRELLAELREARCEWLEFATLLAEGVAFAESTETRVRYLKRAADIWWHQLDELETAVPLLERAYELSPSDQQLRLTLAEALRLTGGLEQARLILDGLLEEFGRRRTPDRANVHYQMALIDRAEQRLSEALEQLDAASNILRSEPIILKTLGDVAQQNGELERAERAYRALLLLVGRTQRSEGSIGESAILFELYRIAVARDDQARAKDLLDSALQAAEQDPGEARRLERALWDAERWDMLLDALSRRLTRSSDATERADVQRTQADVFVRIGRASEALDTLLQLGLADTNDEALDRAQLVAEEHGLTGRFLAAVAPVAEAKEAADNGYSGKLWLRLGYLLENSGDRAAAATHFARAQATAHHPEESFQALRRLYSDPEQLPGLLTALERYVGAEPSSVDFKRQVDARYELAELQISRAGQVNAGVANLQTALELEPDLPRAAQLLRSALAHVAMNAALSALVESVARSQKDDALLLAALSFAARTEATTLEQLDEAITLAEALGNHDEYHALLKRTVEFARKHEQIAEVIPALVAFADSESGRGAFPHAVHLFEEAIANAQESQVFDLELKLAELLNLGMGAPDRAVVLYESLAKRDPSDARAWGPLLELHRQLGSKEALEAALGRAEKHVVGDEQRRALQLERVRLLLDAGRSGDAETLLLAILEQEPQNQQASELLFELMDVEGREAEIRDLLEEHLDLAISRADADSVVRLALRLGRLLEADDLEGAVRIYRMANAAARRKRPLLDALYRLLPEDEPAERADVLESMIPTEGPDGVEQVALKLADIRAALGDEPGVERAYEVGFQTNPRSHLLRDRLETWYREREHWAPLADLFAADGEYREGDEEALGRFLAAAHIYDEQLGDAASAARIMDRALNRLGPQPEVLERLSTYWVTAGDPEHALQVLNNALSAVTTDDSTRALLLHLRGAVLARSGEHDLKAIQEALQDLQGALALGRVQVQADLASLYERQLQLARYRGDDALERDALIRLATDLPALGHAAHALSLLGEWLERHPDDSELTLLRVDRAFDAQDYDTAASAALALFHASNGPARHAAALRYAQACEASGNAVVARPVLEQLFHENPADVDVRGWLKRLYLDTNAYAELAELLVRESSACAEAVDKHALLLEAARTLLRLDPIPQRAVEVFEAALALLPEDHATVSGLAEAYTRTGNIEQACALLESAIKGHGKRRSRELSDLQYAMSVVAQAAGDDEGRFAWLDAALQSDRRNGQVAAELAVFAMDRADYEVAIKALQLITLLKEDCSMSRAEAYLRQAIISQQRSDLKKAALLAKRALATDADYEPAKAFLNEIGPQ